MEESADVVFHPRGGDIPDFTSLVTIQANTAYDLTIYTEPDQQLFLGAVRLQTGQQGDTEFDGVDLAEGNALSLHNPKTE